MKDTRNDSAFPTRSQQLEGGHTEPGMTKLEYLAMKIFIHGEENGINGEMALRKANNFFNGIQKDIMPGIRHITNERIEQIEKHGYTLQHDKSEHSEGEDLINLAIYCLTLDDTYYPATWEDDQKILIKKKESVIDRLAVAGALCAAQIDALLA